jgi:hypothetical protein
MAVEIRPCQHEELKDPRDWCDAESCWCYYVNQFYHALARDDLAKNNGHLPREGIRDCRI